MSRLVLRAVVHHEGRAIVTHTLELSPEEITVAAVTKRAGTAALLARVAEALAAQETR